MNAHAAIRGTFPAFSVFAAGIDDLPGLLTAPTPRFVLLVVADTADLDGTALVEWAGRVLERGATYVCCWGPGCSRLEECFDEAGLLRENFEPSNRVIMTTAHDGEPIEEAAWFALHSAYPDPGWEEGTGAVVLATVGRRDWHEAVTRYADAGAPMPDAA